MIAIIPCTGRGTRRRPDTNHLPKILLQHQGERLIEHIARPIYESGQFEKIVFVISPKSGHPIIEYVRRWPWQIEIQFVWQEKPLGFGHAVLQARDEVLSFRRWNPPILIHTDDAVNTHGAPETDLIKDIMAQSISQIGVSWQGNVKDYGMAIPKVDKIGTKIDTIERLVEKPDSDEGGLALTGIYFIRESRRLFRSLNKLVKTGRILGGEYQLTHALQLMIDAGAVFRCYHHEWIDCGRKNH